MTKNTLLRELTSLNRLQAMKLPEVVAFYCGRIIEIMATNGVGLIGHQPFDSAAEHLNFLGMSGKLEDGYLACGNALRRIGNLARHMSRDIQLSEESTLIALLQVWIEGYAIGFTPVNSPLVSSKNHANWSEMTPWIRGLSTDSKEDVALLFETQRNGLDLLLKDASTAAFAGERLTDCGLAVADEMTREGLLRFSKDRRMRQVRALFLSRNHRMEEAIRELEKLFFGKGKEDVETVGILGGAYKKWWFSSGKLSHLEAAYRYYSTQSYEFGPSYYLLINAAATALWLGQKEDARSAAQEAIEVLKRIQVTPEWALKTKANYWFVATLAEAHLIWEKPKQALRLYEHAKTLDGSQGRWAVTRMQLAQHLSVLPKLQEPFNALVQGN